MEKEEKEQTNKLTNPEHETAYLKPTITVNF